MIKITIDRNKLLKIKQYIIRLLIIKRAYIGHCEFSKSLNESPSTYKDFIKLEFWKIEIAFRQYIGKQTLSGYRNANINLKSILFNVI